MEMFEFFSSLPKQLQKSILLRARCVELNVGEVLYHQGDFCATLVLVESGSMHILRHHECGQSITLYKLDHSRGNNVDISSGSIQTPCIGTAIAQTSCRIKMIPLAELYRLLAGDSAFGEYIFGLFMKRNELLAQTIEDVRFMTLDERVLAWFKQMSQTCLSMTHEEIANYHGTSREVISRLLKRFEGKGYIRLSRKMIEIVKVA